MLFDYFVGSTDTHRAHSDSHAFDYLASQFPGTRSQRVWGLWEGRTEDTVQYTVDLPSDAVAQRVAVALAALTGNDAVLVSRLAGRLWDDARAFDSTARYRVSTQTRYVGNRTLLADPAGWHYTDGQAGIAYVPDVKGSHIAFLAWTNGTLSAVTA